jgi:hypothetical protein
VSVSFQPPRFAPRGMRRWRCYSLTPASDDPFRCIFEIMNALSRFVTWRCYPLDADPPRLCRLEEPFPVWTDL